LVIDVSPPRLKNGSLFHFKRHARKRQEIEFLFRLRLAA
jgi:hypothetical protein